MDVLNEETRKYICRPYFRLYHERNDPIAFIRARKGVGATFAVCADLIERAGRYQSINRRYFYGTDREHQVAVINYLIDCAENAVLEFNDHVAKITLKNRATITIGTVEEIRAIVEKRTCSGIIIDQRDVPYEETPRWLNDAWCAWFTMLNAPMHKVERSKNPPICVIVAPRVDVKELTKEGRKSTKFNPVIFHVTTEHQLADPLYMPRCR